MKIKKKTVSQLIGLAVLLGAVEVTHQLTKTEEQTTYSITLQDLANANSEADGENGGGTDGETGGGNTNNGSAYNWKTIRKCKWVTYTFRLDANGNVISGSIKVHKHSCTNCAYECDTSSSGNCEQPNLCKQSDPYPS